MSKRFFAFYIFFFAFLHCLRAESPVLSDSFWESIKLVPFENHGWFQPANQKMIEHFLKTRKVLVAVELGTWLGKSARFIAAKLPKNAVLYCIDTWEGFSLSQGKAIPEYYPSMGLGDKVQDQYHKFLSNVKHAHLTDKIIPIRMKTDEAARALNIKADFIYIDASHDEQSVYEDIINWYPKLNKNGIMCGDDYGWASVQRATHRAADKLGKRVCNNEAFWWFE